MKYNDKNTPEHIYNSIHHSAVIIFVLIFSIFSCGDPATISLNKGLVKEGFDIPFALNKDIQKIGLARPLKEISGIAIANDSSIYAINDEKGNIYHLARSSFSIIDEIDFGKDDDYEGICIANNIAYVIESNGNIKVVNLAQKEKTDEFDTFLSKRNDVEGVCYYEDEHVLLLACKEEMERNKGKTTKGVYAFDLVSKKLRDDPFMEIDLLEQATEMVKHNLPSNVMITMGLKSRMLSFAPSAIGIDPIGDLVYILSSRGRLLVVCNILGDIHGIFLLDHRHYGQPEGLTFDEKGNLYISNEARSRRANVIVLPRIFEEKKGL